MPPGDFFILLATFCLVFYAVSLDTHPVRIIAGEKKGIDLRCGHGPQFRPTQQLVKGSIFDTLGQAIEGTVFLDLFAGSGSIGIEALSRGAARAVFVEQEHRILKALRTNLERCGFGLDRAEVRSHDAVRYLERAAAKRERFDVIFADPPYAARDAAQRIVDIVARAAEPLCAILVIEHAGGVFAPPGGPLESEKTRQFGQTRVSYFRYRKEAGKDEGNGSALPGNV